MVIASYADRELRWAHALKEVKERLGALFGRIEPRRAALSFLDGLLSGIERKTGWQLAERRRAHQAIARRCHCRKRQSSKMQPQY